MARRAKSAGAIFAALTVLLLLGTTSISYGLTVQLINDPLADGLFNEDGVTGYQYVYDVTSDFLGEIGFGEIHLGGTVGPAGPAGAFDGSQSAWYRVAATDPNRRGMWQVWYHSSVGNSCTPGGFGCEPNKAFNLPAATGDLTANTWDTNVIDTIGDFGLAGNMVPWAMANPYHDPQGYPQDSARMDPGGTLDPTLGLAWRDTSPIVLVGFDSGPLLSMTVRLVHPNSPGPMNYHLTSGHFTGFVTGPTGAPVPEPSTYAMAGVALLGLIFLGWRQMQS